MARASSTHSKPALAEPSYIEHASKSCVLVALLATVSLSTSLALHPLFGSFITSTYHSSILLIACSVSVLLPRLPERSTLLVLATLLGYAPLGTYTLAVWSTRQLDDPRRAAALVQVVFFVPVLSTSIALITQWNNRLARYAPGPITLKAFFALSSFSAVHYLAPCLQRHLPLSGRIHSSNMFVACAAIFTLFATFSPPSAPLRSNRKGSVPSPSRAYIFALPFLLPIFATAFALSRPPAVSPKLPYTQQVSPTPNSAASSDPPATVRLLARAHGPTGIVVVGEHIEQEYRFLRVDHSLLGGRWFGDKVASDARNGLGDSIYTAFALQEAARLVQRKKRDNETALFIGLGVGVAPEAFIAHGINTSVVEVDPFVYQYAREFFGLPEPAHVHLEDARTWLQEYQGSRFDYVVHDVFTGGGVPEHLFTIEFWAALQEIVASDGVVAVNFAGQIGSDSARAVYLTLERSFGMCRAYHDQVSAKLDMEYSFFNIVFFCTPKGTPPPKFRSAKEEDFLVSHLRLHVLSELRQREIKASVILGNITYVNGTVEGEDQWILRDADNSLGRWQQEGGVEHWEVMRQVLPDAFWEMY